MINELVDFYQELDILNLIIFWGIIIVFILLIIFIILLIKNKLVKQEEKQENYETEIPVKAVEPIEEKHIEVENDFIEVENDFNAEELVMDYEKEIAPEKKEVNNITNDIEINKEETLHSPKSQTLTNIPYQKNVLKEMSLDQTSPIGITTRKFSNIPVINQPIENVELPTLESEEVTETILDKIEDNLEPQKKNNEYLQEVSNKIKEEQTDELKRTEYELEQEEEAIISYKELMEKKDTIKMIDEEEAVISIEELMQLKNKELSQEEKLYNLTEDSENDNFIKELKNFRNDL